MELKDCKICRTVTENARYVESINGWRCGDCDLVETATHTVLQLEEKMPCAK